MEFLGIVEQFTDMAGKWRVRVKISDDETIFLKFQDEPTEQQVVEEIGRLDSMEKEAKQKAKDRKQQRDAIIEKAKLTLTEEELELLGERE